MKRLFLYSATIFLVASLLGVNAWLPFQMMGHSHAHAQHDSATHGTPLCTLLCSAGQMAQIADPTPPLPQSYAYNLRLPTFNAFLAINVSALLARGPPGLLQAILFF